MMACKGEKMDYTQKILNLADLLGTMKNLRRRGWVLRNVKNSESDADHSYSLTLLVLLFTPSYLDLLKCLKLAIVHDIPEAICGDFMPGEIAADDKDKREKEAVLQIAKNIDYPELSELFDEYQSENTEEAKFVKALDRLDNVFTARYYQDRQNIALIEEFANGTHKRLQNLDEKVKHNFSEILKILTEGKNNE